MLKNILGGTGVAIVTPFKNGSIDYDALKKLINHIIDGGVEYIVSLGTTGETPVLSLEEKKSILQFTKETINGRVPLVVGCGGNNTHHVIEEIQQLPLDGVVAILSASPYYNKPSQEGIYQHYKHIAEASPLPIILYNVPGRTGRNMNASTTLRLAEIPNIAGIKEASGDMPQCMEILKGAPKDFLVVSGDDPLVLPQIACGMDGVISVAANAFPKPFSNMVRMCLKGDFKGAKELNDAMMESYNLMFAENNPAGIKAYLSVMGIIENELRLPGVPVASTLQKAIEQNLQVCQKSVAFG